MEMHQIRYFLALQKVKNFTRAAEACGVTQPALTRAIQALESELGGALFNRERSQTTLSELGRMMAPYLETIWSQAQAAREQAQAIANLENVTLKIGCMCTIGPAIVSKFIVGFRMSLPGMELAVSDASGQSLRDMLLAGDLEIGIFGLPGELDERLHALPLFSERFLIALPPAHPLGAREAIRVADLRNEPYVMREKCEYADHAEMIFEEQGVENPVVFRSERDDWVQGMIKAGLGFGFMPEFAVSEPDLVTRPLIEPEFLRTISLITVRGRPHSPAVGAFVRQARSFRWPQSPRLAERA